MRPPKIFLKKKRKKSLDKTIKIVYTMSVRQGAERKVLLNKGGEVMDEVSVTAALLRAILELIGKCESLEELRENVQRIIM